MLATEGGQVNVDRTTILLSIRPIYADRILDGTKTIEFRRKPLPESVKTALIWKTGKGGGIVGKFTVHHQRADTARWFTGDPPYDHMSPACGVTADDLIRYAGYPQALIWGIAVADVTSAQGVLDPKSLHPALHRPAQSWRYAPEGWETNLEVPW
jgi:hypothetical protein